jgi:Tol biopolymer transport system component
LTKDGNTAYYSKTVYVKPSTGIFSKKEPVHKIYRADKVQGEWKSIRELALCPNEFSAVHPAVSPDGKRLFFASNMPGTFGDFDIYVASLGSNGSIGVAKNLGEKVNTVRNDMYPKVMEGNTLVFASEGHQGYGGLDMYSVQVASSSVGLAINMGSSINSSQDDFALQLAPQKGMAYVVSNRGSKTKSAHKIEYTFVREKRNSNETDFRLLEAMNTAEQAKYSTSIFEDE